MWQAEVEATIPDLPYQEINFTMPRALWPFFQQNRDLLNDLPAIGARAIDYWVGQSTVLALFSWLFRRLMGVFSTFIHIYIRWYQPGDWTNPEFDGSRVWISVKKNTSMS
jgi:hypothetical protein